MGFTKAGADLLVTRAKYRHIWLEGQDVTGFSIGTGAITARIYNKTFEAKKSGKQWVFELWDAVLPCWRVEFQLLREGLKRFKVETFVYAYRIDV
jgi:hypothetical protein